MDRDARKVIEAARHLLHALNFRDAVVVSGDEAKYRFASDQAFQARDALRDALGAASVTTKEEGNGEK